MNKNLKNFQVWSNKMNKNPKIKSVRAEDDLHLIVEFDNNITKNYDCQLIINRHEFQPLRNKAFFRSVTVDSGGYGVSWNEDIDISEYELWTNGKEIISGKTGTCTRILGIDKQAALR